MKGKVKISFITQNEHKFYEAQEALVNFEEIELVQLNEKKLEDKDDSVKDPITVIAKKAAQKAANDYKCIVVAEDAGIFFDAYDDFPSLNTKWIIKRIGYEGILKLLDGVDRSATFRSAIAVCVPGADPISFEGKISGKIADKVYGTEIDCMDYDRIFIPEGYEVPFSLMMDKKKQLSHRKNAFYELGKYLESNDWSFTSE